MSSAIDKARQEYLAKHPLRNSAAVPTIDLEGNPKGMLAVPDLGDVQIIGMKLGIEYLAICHDDDKVEEWIDQVLSIAHEPGLAMILFANVFRGMNTIIAMRTGTDSSQESRDLYENIAVDGWNKHFGGDNE